MPEHDLLLQINDTVGTILTEVGGMRADSKAQNLRIECIEADVKEICKRVNNAEDYIKAQKIGYKTAMLITGALSALAGAIAGVVGFIWILLQYGGMLKGGGGGTP